MTYKLTPFGKTRLPLPGVPWRDLSDEEMAAAVARHPGIEEQGYFEKVVEEEETAPSSSSRRRTAQPEDVTPAEESTDG